MINLQTYFLRKADLNKTEFSVLSTEISMASKVVSFEQAREQLAHHGEAKPIDVKAQEYLASHLLKAKIDTPFFSYIFFVRLNLGVVDASQYNDTRCLDYLDLYPTFSLDRQIVENYPTSVLSHKGFKELNEVLMWVNDGHEDARIERGESAELVFMPYKGKPRLESRSLEDLLSGVTQQDRHGLMNREMLMRRALVDRLNKILNREVATDDSGAAADTSSNILHSEELIARLIKISNRAIAENVRQLAGLTSSLA